MKRQTVLTTLQLQAKLLDADERMRDDHVGKASRSSFENCVKHLEAHQTKLLRFQSAKVLYCFCLCISR